MLRVRRDRDVPTRRYKYILIRNIATGVASIADNLLIREFPYFTHPESQPPLGSSVANHKSWIRNHPVCAGGYDRQEILTNEYHSFVFEEFCFDAIFWHAAETIDFTGVYVFLARFGISFESSLATLNN